MATITSYTLTDHPRDTQLAISADAAAADIVELTDLPVYLTHVFVSVRFFDGADAAVTPSGGTLDVEIQTLGNTPNWEDPPAPTITAATPTTVDFAANTYGVRVTPTSLTGVDHYVVYVSLNKT